MSVVPVISQTPMSGPAGTTFTQIGTGFSPNSIAILHFRKPDGNEYTPQPQLINANGTFSIPYTAPSSKAPGNYTWWGVDGVTEVSSNSITYTITVKPIVAQTPMSGTIGTKFSQWGTGFTANSTATLHFKKSGSPEYTPQSQPIDGNGTFSIFYTIPAGKAKGTYDWWGVDGPTGKKSKTVSYTVK